jgi:hypothetical protein
MSDLDNFNKWYSKAKEGYQYSEREIAAAAWLAALETVKPFIRAYDVWAASPVGWWSEDFDAMVNARETIGNPDTSAMDGLRARLASAEADRLAFGERCAREAMMDAVHILRRSTGREPRGILAEHIEKLDPAAIARRVAEADGEPTPERNAPAPDDAGHAMTFRDNADEIAEDARRMGGGE